MKEFFNKWRKIQQWLGKMQNISYVFSINFDEPHSFVEISNGENSQHWKKAMDFKFSMYKTIRLVRYLFIFHPIVN
jgi:hypothetical protein